MALLDRVKERIETDLSDSELQAMLDGIVAEIAERHGASSGAISIDKAGGIGLLLMARPIDTGQAITITEYEPRISGDAAAETVLSSSDYRVLNAGKTLERLNGGTNSREVWAPLVRIAYTPIDASANREAVTIKLMQLDIQYRGLTAEKAGDWSANYPDAAAEREKLLASLGPRPGLLMA